MSQWLRNTAPVLGVAFAPDGDQADVGDDVTVTITRSNGTAIATDAVTTRNGTGATTYYTYNLPVAQTANLDTLRLDWKDTSTSQVVTTYEEIVGSLLFTEIDARARQIVGGQTPLSAATYTDALIAGWHHTICDMFEQRTGRSWISRHARVELQGEGSHILSLRGICRTAAGHTLHRPGRLTDIGPLLSVTVNGTAQTVGNYQVDAVSGLVISTSTPFRPATVSTPFNVVIEYEYGLEERHWEAHQRGLDMLLANAAPSSTPSRATSFSNEDGTFRISTFPTEVENFLRHHNYQTLIG